MKRIFLNFIEIAYLTLQYPEELPVYLDRIEKRRATLTICVFVASLSISGGMYSIRDYYSSLFYIEIFLYTVSGFLFFASSFLLVGSFIDALIVKEEALLKGQSWNAIAILFLSALPIWFFFPGAYIAGNLTTPLMVMLPLAFGLFIWMLYIQFKGLQFLYEIGSRALFRIYMKAAIVIVGFPVLSVIFLSSMMTGLLF
jgi:hypothetical protein